MCSARPPTRPRLRHLLLDSGFGRASVLVVHLLMQIQHARRNMVVVRAGVHAARAFRWRSSRQISVGRVLRELVAFPRPRDYVHWLRLPRGNLRFEFSRQFIGNLLRGFAICEVLDDIGVPDAVKVWPVIFRQRIRLHRGIAEECDRDTIPAPVIIGCSVERLVQVADEMNYESQRVGSLLSGRTRLAKDGQLVGNRAGDAAG